MTALAGGVLAAAALFAVLAREPPRLRRVPPRRAAALVAAAVREELIWRWAVLGLGRQLVGLPAALGASVLGFAAAHWRQARGRSVAVHTLTGSVFAGLYLAGDGLLMPLAAHASYNLLVLAAVEAERARPP